MGDLLTSAAYATCHELGEGAFALLAPAKINLFLRVLGRRADGYHEIETLFQEITLADQLDFYPSDEWSLEVHGADLESGGSNLVTQAAEFLSREAGVPMGGRVVLHKRIPIGGGLGGGSSDAAVALMGLSRLWGLDWTRERLTPLAAQLGSDCPFFLHGGLALGRGRGEQIEPLEGCVEGEVLLVVPPFRVSTAWAYNAGRFPLTHDEKSSKFGGYESLGPLTERDLESFRNDLENVVLSEFSELADVKEKLGRLGGRLSMLSGSGSTVFATFLNRSRAVLAAQEFGSPYQVHRCRAVARPRGPG